MRTEPLAKFTSDGRNRLPRIAMRKSRVEIAKMPSIGKGGLGTKKRPISPVCMQRYPGGEVGARPHTKGVLEAAASKKREIWTQRRENL